MKTRIAAGALLAAAMTWGQTALAHHSFAVFFDPGKVVTLRGKVTAFAFTNPHGQISLEVRKADGQVEEWRVETNAPVILVRRGWTRTSLTPGEVITIEGWVSRDGRRYIRMRSVLRADGTQVGRPFDENSQS